MSTDVQPKVSPSMLIRLPPLRAGDRLSQAEFLKRYNAVPQQNDAELIEGVVYTASPVAADTHGEPHFDLVGWLFSYRSRVSGVVGGDNSTVRLDLDNAPQPDAYLRRSSELGGHSRLEDGYVTGPPELIAEVSVTSASYDLHDKLNAYRRNGVQEYLVWRTWDRAIDWFELIDGVYRPLPLSEDRIYRSHVFRGLWLNVDAMLAGNMKDVLATLDAGIQVVQL